MTQTEAAPLWLTLDQGGHASRAIVFDDTGQQVAQAFAPITTRHPDADRVEHDALEILQSLRSVIDTVSLSVGTDIQRVQAAGLATQRSSIVCWHAQSGLPLSPVLSWQDRRNAALITHLQSHQQEIQQLTGLVLSPHYGASKLRWCLDELVEVKTAYQQGQLRFGPLSSYLLHALLTERPHLVDPANASRTQLWSPTSRQWSAQLLQWFGVPESCLPTPVPTLHHYGGLAVGARTLPLRVCTGDQAAVPFASGALDAQCVYINLGTGAFALAPLAEAVANPAPLLRSVLFSSETELMFALEGTVNGAASALQWLAKRSDLNVERATQSLHRQQLENQHIPVFINGIGGIGSPYWLAQVTSRFVFDSADDQSSSAVAELAAVIESIAFLLTANLQLMRHQLPGLTRLVVGGGLSACDYLCQCLAALNQLPVTRLSERELTAKGLAYLVAGQPAHWSGDQFTTQFAPEAHADLQTRHLRWQAQMQILR
jgi:glycerol kinase